MKRQPAPKYAQFHQREENEESQQGIPERYVLGARFAQGHCGQGFHPRLQPKIFYFTQRFFYVRSQDRFVVLGEATSGARSLKTWKRFLRTKMRNPRLKGNRWASKSARMELFSARKEKRSCCTYCTHKCLHENGLQIFRGPLANRKRRKAI